MKNILFLMRYPLEEAYNLKQKFDGQMQSAVNLGYQVYHFAYDKNSVYLVHVNENNKQKICLKSFGFFKGYRSTFGFYDLYKALHKAIKMIRFDCVYMRSKIVDATAIKVFKKFKAQGGKLIVEIPSYGSKEQVLSAFRVIIAKALDLWKKRLPQFVDLYTIIGTDSLTQYNERPAICISNGVCVENYPVHQHDFSGELHILALASMRVWHGYDRLINGLAAYEGETPVYIEMVGNDGDGSLAEWKNLAEEKGVSHLVNFRGGVYGEALTDMINSCDVAAATLGLHRNDSNHGSVLKIREYAARGIPFIYSYNDSCLEGNEPFALKIEANDSPVDINMLADWAKGIINQGSVAEEMRAYAKAHMSWEAQLDKAFNFVLGE